MVTAPEVFGAGAAAVGQNRDPCPRYRKYVEVAYKCKPTQVIIPQFYKDKWGRSHKEIFEQMFFGQMFFDKMFFDKMFLTKYF